MPLNLVVAENAAFAAIMSWLTAVLAAENKKRPGPLNGETEPLYSYYHSLRRGFPPRQLSRS